MRWSKQKFCQGRSPIIAAICLLIAGCGGSPFPGGYKLVESATNREWLQQPDGSLITGGLIQRLYSDDRHILLVSHVAVVEGRSVPPLPLDGDCLIAQLIDTRSGDVRQIDLSQAKRLAATMTEQIGRKRPCLALN